MRTVFSPTLFGRGGTVVAIVLSFIVVSGAQGTTPNGEALFVTEPSAENIFVPGLTVTPTFGGAENPVKDLDKYAFHLRSFSDQDEVSLPCGQTLDIPAGRFIVWVEGPGHISQCMTHTVLPKKPGEEQIPHHLFMEVGTAGRVALAATTKLATDKDLELRLLSVDSHRNGAVMLNAFGRRVLLEDLEPEGVRMPTGPVIATVYDTKRRDYVRLSRPFKVSADRTSIAALPETPSGKANLIVRLERPTPVFATDADDVQVFLRGKDNQTYQPHTVIAAVGRIYAFWYGLEPGWAGVAVESETVWFGDWSVELRAGQVADFSGHLKPTANLEVSIVLPEEFEVPETKVVIRDAKSRVVLTEREFESGLPDELVFGGLPRSLVEAVAYVGPWMFTAEANLTKEDGRVLIAPDSARVTGELLVNGEGTPGKVSFLTNRSSRNKEVGSEHQTDEYGRYDAILFPGQIQVVAFGYVGSSVPIPVWLDWPVDDGDVIDFELEGQDGTVRVVDAKTGTGIPQATVLYSWRREGLGEGGRNDSTDDDGFLRLPPMPGGWAEVSANASGYRRSRNYKVDLSATKTDIVIDLHPEKVANEVTILLPDGSPAVDADVVILSTVLELPRWKGTTDLDGKIRLVSMAPQEIVVMRHQLGGLKLLAAEFFSSEQPTEVRLPPPAGRTVFEFVEPSEEPVASARVVIWIDGYRLASPVLGSLLDAAPEAARDGRWEASYLPAEPIDILAWKLSTQGTRNTEVFQGKLDYRRQSLSPPWGPQVTLVAELP